MTTTYFHNLKTNIALVFVLCCLSVKPLFSQNTPTNTKSLLWEISGKGAQKPSYIYGTMHVSGKLAFNLNDSFFLSIRNCDFVALELDPDLMLSDLVNSKLMKSAFSADAYLDIFRRGFYENQFAPNEISNKTLAGFLARKNDVVNTLLYRSNINSVNQEEDTYLDLFIFQAGKKLGKKIVGLETFEGTMDMYARLLKAESEQENKEKNKNSFTQGPFTMESLEEAYRKGDITLIDSITRGTTTKLAYKYLIVERNKIMYNGIDSLIRSGASVFTGVGAAHLGGEEGILNMLRKNGYTVNPVSWQSLKPSKHKSQIKKMVVSTQSTTQYSTDSTFSAQIPGSMQSLQGVGQEDTYLSTDMTNGSYYLVSGISHNGFINQHDKKYWAQKVDSLLYENIDGTITKKEERVTENGDICFLITSKTRRSDIERYKIIITPFKILMFKVAGNGAYAAGKQADQFLNSVKLYPAAPVNKSENGFSYRFTQENVLLYDGGNHNSKKHLAVSNDGTKFNMLLVASTNESRYIEEDTFELNYIIQKAAEKTNYEVVSINIAADKRSALFEWKKDKETCRGKLSVSGPHYYFLLDNTGNDDFISSFTLSQDPVVPKFNTYTDTSMLFSVNLVDIPEKNDLAELRGGAPKKKPTDADFKKVSYTSKATKETITLTYDKLNQYRSYENLDSVWSKTIEAATDMIDPVVTDKVYSSKNGANVLDCNVYVKDNTHQYIRLKLIQKGRYIYTLNTLCDKNRRSCFADTFYATFALQDTGYGLPATASKTSLYLADLFHADSTTRKDARDDLYMLFSANMGPGDFKALTEAIKKSETSDMEMSDRIQLIKSLQKIKTTECINWLKTYYTATNDTPAYQFAVLYALAGQQTAAATSAFADLIKKETPVTEENYSFNSCFNLYGDSLELIAKVAPRLVFLLEYDEYKERIVELLAALKYNNLITSDFYLANKNRFLTSAGIELKKHIAGQQKSDENDSYNDYDDYDYDEEEGYYNGGHLTKDTAFTRADHSILFDYAILLQPFYNEPNVKSFFDKILKNGTMELQVSTGVLLLKNNIAVENDSWEKWAANEATRTDTYKLLNTIGKTEKYPASYRNLDSVARSLVFQNTQQNNTKDSVILVLKEENVRSKEDAGTLFVYKKYVQDDNTWKWSAVYLKDAGDFDIVQLSTKYFENSFEGLSDAKILERVRLSVRLLGRERCEEVSFYNMARQEVEE